MGTRLRRFSHSMLVKITVFILMIACAAGVIHTVMNIFKVTNGNIEIIFEGSYIDSSSFKIKNNHTINQLADLIDTYKSEENILQGHTINHDEAYSETETVDQFRKEMIADDLENFQMILKNLEEKRNHYIM
ncbi:MAG TPA: hypothetical protein VK135_06380 [Candidatus Dormibacteraeota bacterium]|nr:hypothetical protein [Candidatus Dormibacteraeota bacterium]